MAGTPALTALRAFGAVFTEHTYPHDPTHPSFGWEAVESLGLDPHQVFKTLVWRAGHAPVIAIVSVADVVDAKALARAVGVRKAAAVEQAEAERITGYRVGGISPFGLRTELPTYLDVRATGFDTIYVSAGVRGHEVCVSPSDAVAVTGAVISAIAKPGPTRHR